MLTPFKVLGAFGREILTQTHTLTRSDVLIVPRCPAGVGVAGGSEGGEPSALGTYHPPSHTLGLRPRPRRRVRRSCAACAAGALRDRRLMQFAS
jgi:hypothetical protein